MSNNRNNCKVKKDAKTYGKSKASKVAGKNYRRNREIKDTVDREIQSETNPYSWYSDFPDYAKDAATIPFAQPVGTVFNINTDPASTFQDTYTFLV